MFATLSKYVALAIVLLAFCPVTAPFSTFDFAICSSPSQEAINWDAKTSVATPVVLASLGPVERLNIEPLRWVRADLTAADRLPLLTALRL